MKSIELTGKVKTGLGEGKYYMNLKGYKTQFIRKLGIDPYIGTLNIRLSRPSLKKIEKIKRAKGILAKGFKMGKRNFGDVVCYKAQMSGIKCALVVPKLSVHTKVAEIISSERLRKALKLKEGSKAKVLVRI